MSRFADRLAEHAQGVGYERLKQTRHDVFDWKEAKQGEYHLDWRLNTAFNEGFDAGMRFVFDRISQVQREQLAAAIGRELWAK